MDPSLPKIQERSDCGAGSNPFRMWMPVMSNQSMHGSSHSHEMHISVQPIV